ncbi:FAD binding domain-containing protein [Gryllotalpicola protaetiae]|uniref:FAD-binding molybdopterin dehydrogenase n=1 Tax=Gryllotalpicola protaetiae TaxID=2419771 RepID=A0A387BP84_9MICO|nr:FAD binding domain-containing protein [Gryllotalpicola protaetiae]AYG02810.1 FAD-binding molybdopterin dehydrogenase [Gryllotalpicola protaetiae]
MDLTQLASVRTPRSRDELALAPGEVFLGGGTWLYSEPQPGVTGVVDLMTMGWVPLERRRDGGLRVAATCTLEQLNAIRPELGGTASPVFAQAVRSLLAGAKVWRTATVGGNLCFSAPASPIPALAAVLDASIKVWGPGGKRRIAAADFVTGAGLNALEPGELVRAVDIPAAALEARVAWRRIALAPLGRAGVFVAGRREASDLAVVVAGARARPGVLRFERMPEPGELAGAVDALGDWYADPHGSAAWRRAMAVRLAGEVRDELEGAA